MKIFTFLMLCSLSAWAQVDTKPQKVVNRNYSNHDNGLTIPVCHHIWVQLEEDTLHYTLNPDSWAHDLYYEGGGFFSNYQTLRYRDINKYEGNGRMLVCVRCGRQTEQVLHTRYPKNTTPEQDKLCESDCRDNGAVHQYQRQGSYTPKPTGKGGN